DVLDQSLEIQAIRKGRERHLARLEILTALCPGGVRRGPSPFGGHLPTGHRNLRRPGLTTRCTRRARRRRLGGLRPLATRRRSNRPRLRRRPRPASGLLRRLFFLPYLILLLLPLRLLVLPELLGL